MKTFVFLGILFVPFSLLGQSWTSQTSGTTEALTDVLFTDANIGWIVGSSGIILCTTNGGAAWSFQTSGTTEVLTGVHFADANIGWIVGSSGIILHTTDGGAAWSFQTSGTTTQLHAVHFIDANTGWAVGGWIDDGIILYTTNGGISWVSQGQGTYLNDVHFIDANTGWVAGIGTILHTTDGGTTWLTQASIFQWINGIHFVNATNGWAVGSEGAILHTSDGGTTWSNQNRGSAYEWLTDVYATNMSEAWVVGNFSISPPYDGIIYHTADGGTMWRVQQSGTDGLNGVHFVDANSGWAVGNGGTILHYSSGSSLPPVSVAATVSSASGDGTFDLTIDLTNNTDSSQTIDIWMEAHGPEGLYRGPRVVYEKTPLAGVSYSKTIAKELDDNAPLGEYSFVAYVGAYPDEVMDSSAVVYTKTLLGKRLVPSTGEIPEKLVLFENYPNPFNPSTRIEYALPQNAVVRLEVFSVLGERVRVLTEGIQEAGYHTVPFDAEELPSGVYFYRLQAGEFVETKKLVLMK